MLKQGLEDDCLPKRGVHLQLDFKQALVIDHIGRLSIFSRQQSHTRSQVLAQHCGLLDVQCLRAIKDIFSLCAQGLNR